MRTHSFRLPACVALAGVALAAAAGCGAGEGAAPPVVVRDSAGITIVESAGPAWREGQEWRLTDRPSVSIGLLEGDERYQLFRVMGAARLSDGRIAVANGGTREIRFYDAGGRYLRSAGREGEGPGEFKELGALAALPGDTLLAYDWSLRRVSVIDPAGAFVRSARLELPEGFPQFVGAFRDGSILARTAVVFGADGAPRAGVHRSSTPYFRFGSDGVARDTLGEFPGPEAFVRTQDRGFSVTSRYFGRTPQTAIHGDRFYFGASDSYEIGVYAADGTLERLVRREFRNPPVTAADIETYNRERIERAESEGWRDFAVQMQSVMSYPETFPAYGSIQVDASGHLWVEEYRRPGDDQPRWTIFDPEGRMLGTVLTPPEFTVYEIGPDYVLGRWRDEFEVEYVHLYTLVKPEAGG